MNVWLVWILSTKRKSLKRVETCQKKRFTFWLFAMLTHSSDLIFQMVFTLWIHIYLFNLFRIEPLIVHLYLNDIVLIWGLKGYLDCVWRIVPILHTVCAYWKCAIIPLGPHWPAMVMIISSCLVSNCYPVSYMRRLPGETVGYPAQPGLTWRNRRLPSPTRINLFLCDSVRL